MRLCQPLCHFAILFGEKLTPFGVEVYYEFYQTSF